MRSSPPCTRPRRCCCERRRCLVSDDLRTLYQEIILNHGGIPLDALLRSMRPYVQAQGSNPMCGDRVTVTAKVSSQGQMEEVAFEGKGCAISIASASMMTEALKGQSLDVAHKLFPSFWIFCTQARPEATQ